MALIGHRGIRHRQELHNRATVHRLTATAPAEAIAAAAARRLNCDGRGYAPVSIDLNISTCQARPSGER